MVQCSSFPALCLRAAATCRRAMQTLARIVPCARRVWLSTSSSSSALPPSPPLPLSLKTKTVHHKPPKAWTMGACTRVAGCVQAGAARGGQVCADILDCEPELSQLRRFDHHPNGKKRVIHPSIHPSTFPSQNEPEKRESPRSTACSPDRCHPASPLMWVRCFVGVLHSTTTSPETRKPSLYRLLA